MSEIRFTKGISPELKELMIYGTENIKNMPIPIPKICINFIFGLILIDQANNNTKSKTIPFTRVSNANPAKAKAMGRYLSFF